MVTRAGFTLLELVIVLAILAALASVAVRSLDSRLDQTKYDNSRTQLKQIKDAILGPQDLRNADGTLMATGFMSDMGRPPISLAHDTTPGTPVEAQELWGYSGTALIPQTFALRAATLAFIGHAFQLSAPDQPWTMAPTVGGIQEDPAITVASGYRGPYLELPNGINDLVSGKAELKDGWDQPFVLFRAGSQVQMTTPNGLIGAMVSYGEDNLSGGTGFNADLDPVQFVDDGVNPSLGSVSVRVNVADASAVTTGTPLVVRLYGPDPEASDINKQICYYEQPAIAETGTPPVGPKLYSFNFPLSHIVSGHAVCTIGARVLRAYIGTTLKSNIRTVTISRSTPTIIDLTISNAPVVP